MSPQGPLSSHPEIDRLRQSLERCRELAVPWSGVAYRSASVPYANRDDLLTGAGARRAGARWNAPGTMLTNYLCLEPRTAVEESLAHHRYYGIPVEQALPRVLVAVQIQLQHVLDLTRQPVRRRLGLTRQQLLQENWRLSNSASQEALTQALGRLAYATIWWEGLLVPSAADPGGVNIVFFPGNVRPPESFFWIVNREQLPAPGQ